MSLADGTVADGLLDGTRWAGWTAHALAGDASSRRYWRLCGDGGQSVILMDNGAPDGNGFPAFETLSTHLHRLGLIAPRILHVTADRRHAVTTDLGRITLAERIRSHPGDETHLYPALVDVLPLLAAKDLPPGLVRLTPDLGARMIAPLFENAAVAAPPALHDEIGARIEDAMDRVCTGPMILSLRDFHAENIIWRDGEEGTDRFGLLDYQDAFVAPPEYDLASLLRDVRRDVAQDAHDQSLARFAERSGKTLDHVTAACAMLALQRNLRILGIFARLAAGMGKVRYLDFLPRTARLIREDAAHPALTPLAGPVDRLLGYVTP